MKPIQFRDALKTISSRIVSWFSIVTIMMLGTTGILGILYAGTTLRDYAVEYLEDRNYHDFDMVSCTGVSQEDLDIISGVEGVSDAEGIIKLEGSLSYGEETLQLKLFSPTERVSVPEITSGRAPVFPNECALCRDLVDKLGIMEGDKVKIHSRDTNQEDILVEKEFTVTGFVAHPEYVTRDLEYYALLSQFAFDREELGNVFTDALVVVDLPEGYNQLSRFYFDRVKPVQDALEEICPSLAEEEENRIRKLREELSEEDQKKLDERLSDPDWAILGRNASTSFLGLNAAYQVLSSISIWFTPLFALIALMVCFSTITIVVEEQKIQIGTLKALGMDNRQVRAKYMMYGITAAVTGELLGVVGAMGMEKVILFSLKKRYLFGEVPLGLELVFTAAMVAGTTLLSAVVVYLSCNKLIKCSAVALMNGSEPGKKAGRKTKAKARRGNLYFSMILRNMRDDIVRVIVSIIIVLESVLLIGTGITMEEGLAGALDNQTCDIWKYDLIVKFDAEEDYSAQIEKKLAELGTECFPAYEENCVASDEEDSFQTGVMLYAVDNEDGHFPTFFALKDESGDPVVVPDSGGLVTEEMYEKDGFYPGDKIRILKDDLGRGKVMIEDVFMNHIGKYVIISGNEYERVFGSRAENNIFLVRLNGASEEAVRDALLPLPFTNSIERSDKPIEQYRLVLVMYNLVVMIIIIMVVILAFMVQLNLSNIQINRRLKEILVMRVNGFSMFQVVNYLIRETLLTTCLGIALGICAGIPFASFLIPKVEFQQILFVRTVCVIGWVKAALYCVLFSAVINTIAFRKIRTISLTSISK